MKLVKAYRYFCIFQNSPSDLKKMVELGLPPYAFQVYVSGDRPESSYPEFSAYNLQECIDYIFDDF